MKKILILGATGLIGHQVYFRLNANKNFVVSSFARQRKISDDTVLLDARDEHFLEKVIVDINPDVIVNCMGVLIAELNSDPENAIFLNAYIPQRLKNIANSIGTTTDSVFMKISNMIYILSNGSYGHSNYSEDSRLALFEFLDKNRNVSLNRLLTILK